MNKALMLVESNFDTQTLCEEKNGTKNWYINGIFMQEDVNNRNRRFYPKNVMESTVNNYVNEYVKTSRAVGELSHPDTPAINLERVSHIIESISHEGKNYIGRAKVLKTPMGSIAIGLLEGGVKLGVSSRGTGSLVENGSGINVVQPDYKLSTIDIVYNPSAPDAFVQGLMEGHSFVWNTLEEDVEFVEQLKKGIKKTSSKNLQEAKIDAFKKFMDKVKG